MEDEFDKLSIRDDQTNLDEKKKKAIEIHKEAKKEFGEGHLIKSIELWTEAIKLSPKEYLLYTNRSLAYLNKCIKNYSEALNDAEKAISLHPEGEQGYLRKGEALVYLKRWPEAFETYDTLINVMPSNQKVYLQKGKALANLNRWIEARDTLERGLKVNPNCEKLQVEFADVNLKGLLPQTRFELLKEAYSLGLSFTNLQLDSPRKRLLYYVWSSYNIGRSTSQASLLLVGDTGAGKSSTVNHLFKNKDPIQNKMAETNANESETRCTTEYRLLSDEPKLEALDLTLGVVDTPGFNDTLGLKQDSCNFFSIKNFYNNHPNLKGCSPNLIFVVVNAMGNRNCGPNSNLAKSLRCINKLNLIDRYNPNVVGVLTHSCSKPPKKWKKEIDDKKEEVRSIIFQSLYVLAPVVAIENEFDNFCLNETGHYTVLPDGEWQLKNLYDACENLLTKNKDHLGLAIFNACFLKVDRTSIGFREDAKDAKSSELTIEEENFCSILEIDSLGGIEDKFSKKAETFIENEDLSQEEINDIRMCTGEIRRLGIVDEDELKYIRVGTLTSGNTLSESCKKFLKELQVETKPVYIESSGVIGEEYNIGRGYNIQNDEIVASQIFEMITIDTKFGVNIPSIAIFETVNEIQPIMIKFQDDEAMGRYRMMQMDIGLDIDSKQFKFKEKPGTGVPRSTLFWTAPARSSLLLEVRLFKLKMTNFDGSQLPFSEDFKSDVKNLPESFDASDVVNKSKYEEFFKRWGQFVVASIFCGGSMESYIDFNSRVALNITYEDLQTNLNITYNSIFNPNLNTSAEKPEVTQTKNVLSACKATYVGGDKKFHSNSTFEGMRKWKISLIECPKILETEMQMLPISTVIGCIDSDKQESSLRAIEGILGGKFKQTNFQEGNNKKEEQEKASSNTLEGTIKDPVIGTCFPSSVKVSVLQGNKVFEKNINNISVSDLVLVRDMKLKSMMFSPVIMFAHFKELAIEEYLCITLANGKQIKLSDNHLIMVGKEEKMALAKEVKINDFLSLDNEEKVKVVNIKKVLEKGIFCPVTYEGTIFVNNILASCYASVNNYALFNGTYNMSGHDLAHLGLLPIRIWYNEYIKSKLNKKDRVVDNNMSEIHPYIRWLCKLKLPWMSKV